MKLIRSLLFLFPFVSSIMFTSCGEEPASKVTPVSTGGLSKLTLPAGAVISQATLNLYVEDPSGNKAAVHKVNVAWNEAETWDSFFEKTDPQFDPILLWDFNVTAGLHKINITELVKAWVDSTTPNYGVLLDQPVSADGYGVFRSREYGGDNQPFLEVTYTVDGGEPITVQEPAFIDAYIWSSEPDESIGSDDYLRLAKVGKYHKIVLIQFNIGRETQDDGCTRTIDYWKLHSTNGPESYDSTWALIGEDTQFFLSGNTYLGTANWHDTNDNAYYNLAFEYIAAQLNQLAGASIPADVLNAFNSATTLFNTYTPAQVGALGGSNPSRQQFIAVKDILEKYNNGITGPGKCN